MEIAEIRTGHKEGGKEKHASKGWVREVISRWSAYECSNVLNSNAQEWRHELDYLPAVRALWPTCDQQKLDEKPVPATRT